MAIYHASTKPIARSAGRSAVAAAAYRAGVELVDARTGLVHDYTRKGGVELTDILTPDGQGAERNVLWDAAEQAEKRKDARTAREWIVALPAELDAGQRRDLARDFAQALVERYGVAADLAIHAPDREGDNRNHHAHILTTTRQVSRAPDGGLVLGAKAHIELSDKARRERGLGAAADEVKAVRELWEHTANAALERAGVDARIDARSLEAQGIDREATQHLGPVASEMERRGKASDRGDGNREVSVNNTERARLTAEIIGLQAERTRREQARQAAELLAQRQKLVRLLAAIAVRREAEARARAERERIEAEREARRQKLLAQDRATEQETRSGIRHPDKPRWQAERERILTQSYNADVAEKMGRWYRVERGPEGITLSNREAVITDYGDRITSRDGNGREIEAMVDLARGKGWERVSLTGAAEFQERAARAFVEADIGLVDPQLERVARDGIEADRRKAAREQVAREQAAQEREAMAAQSRTVERTKKTPSTEVVPGIRYLVEETADHAPYKDSHGEVMLFESEAQALEFRTILRGTYPIVRIAVEPEPQKAPAVDDIEALERAATNEPVQAKPAAEPVEVAEKVSPDLPALEVRRQKLLDFAEALQTDAVTNIEDVREGYLAAGYVVEQRERGAFFVYPPGDLLEARKAVTQARKDWKERADRSGAPEPSSAPLQEPRRPELTPEPDDGTAKKQALRDAAKLGERWQYAWDNSSIGTRAAVAGQVLTQIETGRKKVEAGDSPLTLSDFNKAVIRGKQRGKQRGLER